MTLASDIIFLEAHYPHPQAFINPCRLLELNHNFARAPFRHPNEQWSWYRPMIALMIQDVLVSPTAKLDISKLVESSPSPSPSPPRRSTSSRPSLSRSFSASVTGSDARFATSPTTSTAHPGPVTNIPVGAADTPRQQRISGPAPVSVSATSVKRTASTSPRESRQANKKMTRQWTKWEDNQVLERRQRNPPMTWDEIAAEIPNRSAIACRLRFQNYMERKAEWTDAEKEQLARLYDRYVVFSIVFH